MFTKRNYKSLRVLLVASFLLVGFLVIPSCKKDKTEEPSKPTATDPNPEPEENILSQKEQELYDLIMDYRAEYDLPVIPLSKSLTTVAQVHAKDLQDYFSTFEPQCNMHSWSEHGNWTACCYTSDHAQASCMWDKPRELTSYTGNGYEISSYYSGTMSASMALNSWKSSPGHNNVIINQETWASTTWQAIGIGISQNYAVVWFGKELDEE